MQLTYTIHIHSFINYNLCAFDHKILNKYNIQFCNNFLIQISKQFEIFRLVRKETEWKEYIQDFECNSKSKIFKNLDKFFLQNLKILRFGSFESFDFKRIANKKEKKY